MEGWNGDISRDRDKDGERKDGERWRKIEIKKR